jgi:hypothetical protein
MSTQWDAANPTSSNGVTNQMLLNYERQARAAKLPPVTIEDIEQEMLAVAAGRSQLSYNLQSAATADQLRNWVAIIQGGRKKAKKQPSKGMEGTSEGMNFLSIATSVNAAVPNPASGVHAIVRFIYERKMLQQVYLPIHQRVPMVRKQLTSCVRFRRFSRRVQLASLRINWARSGMQRIPRKPMASRRGDRVKG